VEARLLEIPTAQPAADAQQMDDEEEAMLDGMENAADGADEPVADEADEAEPVAGDQTAGTPSPAE